MARERQGEFFEESPELTDRDWIVEGFNALSVSPVAAGLFEWHNPMWSILPSHEAAKALLAFWRDQDANAQIVHDFTDETWNTRFLGDLYQDLSEYAKKTYALLQTPEFVEEFILKYTLDPAIEEFGLEPEPPYGHPDLPRRLRVIDPACGSGHFLLGAFHRLLTAWQNQAGDTDKWDPYRPRPGVGPRRRQEPLRSRDRPLPPDAPLCQSAKSSTSQQRPTFLSTSQ